MILPDRMVQHVANGGETEARVAVNRTTSGVRKPVLVILANEVAVVDFTNAFKKAIDAAKAEGDTASVEAWKALILNILSAYAGVSSIE